MRNQLDSAIAVVTSSEAGFTAEHLKSALVRWPNATHLALLGVSSAADLAPLTTASLAGLTSLTIRKDGPLPRVAGLASQTACVHGHQCSHIMMPWRAILTLCRCVRHQRPPPPVISAWRLPVFSTSLAATLQVVDVSCCTRLVSIDAVRTCAQLRCLCMAGGLLVSALSPLAACSQLEEVWMAGNLRITSLAPLKACPKLRKLDLRGCYFTLREQAVDLQLSCTELAHLSSVELEGRVHELWPNVPPGVQVVAAHTLERMAVNKAEAITSAGAIPPLVELLGKHSGVQMAATRALKSLAAGHAANQTVIVAAGAIPPLVLLLLQKQHSSPNVPQAAVQALACLAVGHAENKAAIFAAGAIPKLVQLLGHSSAGAQRAAIDFLKYMADGTAQSKTAMATAIPPLLELLGHSSSEVQTAAVQVLSAVAANDTRAAAAIVAAGALVPLLKGPQSPPHVQQEASAALDSLAAGHAQNQAYIAAAGAIPFLVQLLGPDTPLEVQRAAELGLCLLGLDAP
ncbi:hypothetical protein FOA52_013616 [Chlamydomonas sp. UWO 241]|nr:hypothetical protein FOA52_013616 [Chlamydomonas sp. UWO 241]